MTENRRQGNGKIMKMHTLKYGMGLNFTGLFFTLNAYIIGEGWKWTMYPIEELIKSEIKLRNRKKSNNAIHETEHK